jgi:hypothetical protein
MPSTATVRGDCSVRYSSDWSIEIPRISDCTTPAPAQVRIAQTMRDRMAAFGLVYDKYLAKGMLHPNPFRMRVIEHHLLPTTTVFVAVRDGEVVATVTLIGDGALGLPMDHIHPEVTESVRDRQLYVGEVSCLAFKKQEMKFVLPIFIDLTRLMAQFARANGMQQFLIGCIPQHARFYCRFLGFEQIGQVRPYPTVCNTLGVACCLDFERVDRDRPDCYDKYFGKRLPDQMLHSEPMSPFEEEAFAQVAHESPQQLLQMV